MPSRVYNHSNVSVRKPFNSKCDFIVNIFKWFPVIFIASVLAWGYYAYVIQLCLFTIDSVIIKSIYLPIFHVIYIFTLWSYWQTIFTDIGEIPRDFWLPPSEKEKLFKETNEEVQKRILDQYVAERNLPINCRTYNSMYRICEKCFMIKPDRAHHCSVCNSCVLKMDHHCPWVNNCVSFTNYKFFILFLGYSFLLCIFSAATSFPYFLLFWKNALPDSGKFHILFLFFVSIMFAISLISLFAYHIYLVLQNRSTLESFRAPIFSYGIDKNGYNLGKYRNFCEVFGEDRVKWFIPIYTSLGDGIVFPTRERAQLLHYEKESQSETPLPHQQCFYNSNSMGHSDSVGVCIESHQSHSHLNGGDVPTQV